MTEYVAQDALIATRLSKVDGEAGQLSISGFALEEISLKFVFEEMIFLLLYGDLPTSAQLDSLKKNLAAHRQLSPSTIEILKIAIRQNLGAMDALRLAISGFTLADSEDSDEEAVKQDAIAIIAAFPSIVAAYWRLLNGLEIIAPSPKLDHASNYLYMLFGEQPINANSRALEIYLNTVVDHGLNASTLTARVIISTRSDILSATVGAIGSLKGPLHGGAPGPALNMIFDIGERSQAEPYLLAKLMKGERLMGFGHRVYRTRDPRAIVLAKATEEMYRAKGDMALFDLARHVEETALRLLAEHKPNRVIKTNVEYYTALILHELNIPKDLFTATFAISRVVGWMAHCLEQKRQDRLIRAKGFYVGVEGRDWVSIAQRGD